MVAKVPADEATEVGVIGFRGWQLGITVAGMRLLPCFGDPTLFAVYLVVCSLGVLGLAVFSCVSLPGDLLTDLGLRRRASSSSWIALAFSDRIL